MESHSEKENKSKIGNMTAHKERKNYNLHILFNVLFKQSGMLQCSQSIMGKEWREERSKKRGRMVNEVKTKKKNRCHRLWNLMSSVTTKERHSLVQEDRGRGR